MKTSTSRAAASISAAVAFSISCQSAIARVGEPQEAIERRIIQPNVGKLYFKAKDKEREAPQMERERLREEREIPFNEVRKFFPTDTREAVYWKSAVGGRLDPENGWKVHIFYVAGRSALEAYRRVGEPLNEFEVRALLALNRGNTTWKKIPKTPESERQAERAPAFNTNGIGYDYETEDGTMRAKQKGDWLMVFSARLDSYVVEQQKLAKAQHDSDMEKLKSQQQGRAPESIQGF